MQKNQSPFGKKIFQDLLLLGANDDYKAEMKKLSRKYNPPFSENQTFSGKEELAFLKNPKSRELAGEYLKMFDKYNLNGLYDILMPYLLEKGHLLKALQGKDFDFDSDEVCNHLFLASGVELVEKKKDYLTLNIHKNATIKDLQKCWPQIKKSLKKTGRKKECDNLERDLKILALKEQGLKAKEITKEINANPKFENQKITYQEVSRIIKRLKLRAKKNMPYKDS